MSKNKFYLDVPSDIEALEAYANFTYIEGESGEIQKLAPLVYVARVDLLEPPFNFGLYARCDLTYKDLSFIYAGERLDQERDNNKYIFCLDNEKGYNIDAIEKGNGARFVNHGFAGSMVGIVENNKVIYCLRKPTRQQILKQTGIDIEDKKTIAQLAKEQKLITDDYINKLTEQTIVVYKDQQLLIDYKKNYFYRNKPVLFINPADTFNDASALINNKDHGYKLHQYMFGDLSSEKQFRLHFGINRDKYLLSIPHLIRLVMHKKHSELSEFLKTDHCDPNIPLLIQQKDLLSDPTIVDRNQQQSPTALMLACYLNDAVAIELLLQHHKINVNQNEILSGKTAVFYLLQQHAASKNNTMRFNILKMLIAHNAKLTIQNEHEHNILHQAIIYNDDDFIENLLSMLDGPLFKEMLQQQTHREYKLGSLCHGVMLAINGKCKRILRLIFNNVEENYLFENIAFKDYYEDTDFYGIELALVNYNKHTQRAIHEFLKEYFYNDNYRDYSSKKSLIESMREFFIKLYHDIKSLMEANKNQNILDNQSLQEHFIDLLFKYDKPNG